MYSNVSKKCYIDLFGKNKNSLQYMTCFWDGILRSLDKDDFLFGMKQNIKPNTSDFINWLKNTNTPMIDVHWNNKELSPREIKEHGEAINQYDVDNIRSGHLCSSCDSFLLLIS